MGYAFKPKMKYSLLDEICKLFQDRAAELVKARCKFVYVLDNIDLEEKAQNMRKDFQNKGVHAVARSIVFDRISNQGLPNTGSQHSL